MGNSLIDLRQHPKLLPRILYALCAAQPVLDALSYWQAELGFTVIFYIRALLLGLIALGGYLLSKKKPRYYILFAVIGLFWAAHVFTCLKNGYSGWVEDLSNYIRVIGLPITAFALISCLKAQSDCYNALLRGLFYAFCVILLLELLALITGTEPYTYSNKSIGLRGWSFWPNAQSAILSALAPMAICYALRKWLKKGWPVMLVSALALGMLFLHGTRLAYGCLLMTSVGLAITVLIRRLPKKFFVVFLLLTVIFAVLFPVSPMLNNQKKVAENAEAKQRLFLDLIKVGEQQASIKQAQEDNYTVSDYKLDRLEPAYSYYLPGLVDRFGMEKVAEAYDYSEDISVIANERTWKLTYCKLLMDSSETRLSRFFGLNVSDMFSHNLSHDCENDFHAIYYLYGYVGLGITVLFLAYYVFLIVRAMIKDAKHTFSWRTACIGISFLALLAHAYCTCGVLRRSNTLFYLAAVLALIYCTLKEEDSHLLWLKRKHGSTEESDLGQ